MTTRSALTGFFEVVAAPPDAVVPLAVVVSPELVAVEGECGNPVQLNAGTKRGEKAYRLSKILWL